MPPSLTIIIPIRHQDNAPNWDSTVKNLKQTMRSISAQTDGLWRCIIVANYGAVLPEMQKGFEVCRVDFPPNKLHAQDSAYKEEFYESIRADKGLRILAGILYARKLTYLMVVDDDDLINSKLADYVNSHIGDNGWYINRGFVWGDGGNIIMDYFGFHLFCGTSHIVRADLIKLPSNLESADIDYVKMMLGSHVRIKEELAKGGTPLSPLPFHGAIYRIGHQNSHSKSKALLHHFFMHKWLLKDPKELFRRLMSLRFINKSKRSSFFGKV